MMYRKISLLFILLIAGSASAQQQTITLGECLAAAMKNHPLQMQNDNYAQSSKLQQQNIDNGKLPQLNVNGQATYQNEVVELPFKLPGVTTPVIPKAQYKLSLDANQLIYGGGNIAAQDAVEDYSRQINQMNNDAELYKMRERINQLYFSILLSDLNAGVINNTIADLTGRRLKVEASVKEVIAPIPFMKRMTISTIPKSMIGTEIMLKGVSNLPFGLSSRNRNFHMEDPSLSAEIK